MDGHEFWELENYSDLRKVDVCLNMVASYNSLKNERLHTPIDTWKVCTSPGCKSRMMYVIDDDDDDDDVDVDVDDDDDDYECYDYNDDVTMYVIMMTYCYKLKLMML